MKPIKKKLVSASKIFGKFIETQKDLTSIEVDPSFFDGLESAEKKLTGCDKISLPHLSKKGIAALYESSKDFASGSEILEAASALARDATSLGSDLDSSNKRITNIGKFISTQLEIINKDNPITSYSNQLNKKMLEYGRMVSRVNKLINDQNEGRSLAIDTSDYMKLMEELSSTFTEYKSAIQGLNRSSSSGETKVTEREAQVIDTLDSMFSARLSQLDQSISNAERVSKIAINVNGDVYQFRKFQKSKAYKFIKSTADISTSMKIGNYERIGVMLGHAFDQKGVEVEQSRAQSEFYKHLSGMSKGFGFVSILNMGLMAIKQFVGLLFGINNIAAEFNNELIETHGLVSQGYNLSHSVEFDATQTFNKFRSMFYKFGWETKSYLSPEQLMDMTSQYEEMGIKIKELVTDQVDVKDVLNVTLDAAIRTGMELSKVSSYQADWRRNLGMDARTMNLVLRKAAYSMEQTGIPAEMYLDAIQNSQYDLGGWTDSLFTLLDLQEKIFSRKETTGASAKQSFKYFMDFVNGMQDVKWAEIGNNLPAGKFAEILAQDEARARKLMKEAKTDTQRSKAEYNLTRLMKLKENPDPSFQLMAFGSIASVEAKIDLMRSGIRSKLGSNFIKDLETGVLSLSQEEQLKKMLGFTGDLVEWEKMRLTLLAVLQPDFDYKSMRKSIEDAKDALGTDEIKELNKEIVNAYLQQAKFEDVMGSMFRYYMVPIINSMENILSHVRRWWDWLLKWRNSSGGGGTAGGGSYQQSDTPNVQWVGTRSSTNYRKTNGRDITGITLHHTAGGYQNLISGSTGTSAHYVVKRDGTIIQLVADKDIAYHAKGGNLNTIGIEHESKYVGGQSGGQNNVRNWSKLTKEQEEASRRLVLYLAQKYNIKHENIIGHTDHYGGHGKGTMCPANLFADYGGLENWKRQRLISNTSYPPGAEHRGHSQSDHSGGPSKKPKVNPSAAKPPKVETPKTPAPDTSVTQHSSANNLKKVATVATANVKRQVRHTGSSFTGDEARVIDLALDA